MKAEILAKLKHKDCEPSELFKFLGQNSYYDLLIGSHPNLDSKNQEKILQKGSDHAKIGLVSNPSLVLSVAKKLVHDKSMEVRLAVASAENLTSEVFEEFSHNAPETILKVLINNPEISSNKLEQIFDKMEEKGVLDKNTGYLIAFATNPKSNEKILEKIAEKNDPTVKKMVLTNKNTPAWVVSDLKREFPELAKNHQKGNEASVGALLEGIEHYAKKTRNRKISS